MSGESGKLSRRFATEAARAIAWVNGQRVDRSPTRLNKRSPQRPVKVYVATTDASGGTIADGFLRTVQLGIPRLYGLQLNYKF